MLHTAELGPEDSVAFAGFRVTTPLRTLLDSARDDSVPTEQLELAVRDALDRGLVTRRRLTTEARRALGSARLLAALEAGAG